MSIEQLRKKITYWTEYLAPLGLSHFRITEISIVDMADEDAKATIEVSIHYDECVFRFDRAFIDTCGEHDLNQAIIHELLHACWRDLDMAMESAEHWMPPLSYEDFRDRERHEVEGLIDRISRTILMLHDIRN